MPINAWHKRCYSISHATQRKAKRINFPERKSAFPRQGTSSRRNGRARQASLRADTRTRGKAAQFTRYRSMAIHPRTRAAAYAHASSSVRARRQLHPCQPSQNDTHLCNLFVCQLARKRPYFAHEKAQSARRHGAFGTAANFTILAARITLLVQEGGFDGRHHRRPRRNPHRFVVLRTVLFKRYSR